MMFYCLISYAFEYWGSIQAVASNIFAYGEEPVRLSFDI